MFIESSSSTVRFRTKTLKDNLNGLSAAVTCFSLLVAVLMAARPAIAATWFVATNGINHASRGHIPTQPWKTLSYAALRADPGDVIYVKAGTYGVPNDAGLPQSQKDSNGVVIVDAGVKFIGYHTSWQNLDLDQGQGVPATYSDFYYPPAQLKPMPEIVGVSRSSYTGIQINSPANSVIVKNFRSTNFQTGLITTSSNNTIKNIVASKFGDVNTGGGRAIWIIGGNSNIIENCFVLNATDEGISLYHTDYNMVNHCKVFCDDNSTYEPGAMDYYILISDGTSNEIVDCFIQRLMDPLGNGAPAHGGHGYHIQAQTSIGEDSQENWIYECTAWNIDEPFSLRGVVVDNWFVECDSDLFIQQINKENETTYAQGCISIVGGPETNGFSRVSSKNSIAAISFFDLNYDANQTYAGYGNIFENCITDIRTKF
jgi:parallel beta-helix repeat protein